MKIKRHANGVYYVHFRTAKGTARISLRTRNAAEARSLATRGRFAEVEAAAKANALTAEVVGRAIAGRRIWGDLALVSWRDWAAIAGLSPNTASLYDRYIGIFLRQSGFCQRTLAAATERDIDNFVNPQESAIVIGTRRARLAAMSSFFGFAQAKGFTLANPANLVRVRLSGLSFEQKEPKRRQPFSDDEMQRLRSIEHPFWATFVLLGEHYGLRLSDVAQLERGCLSKPGVIVIWTDKRDRRLELPLDPAIRDHLTGLEPNDASLFFPREAAIVRDPKRRAALSVEFTRLIRRYGIRGKSAHCLRHTFATKRAGLGDSVDAIRLKLGHVAADTTERYVHTSMG